MSQLGDNLAIDNPVVEKVISYLDLLLMWVSIHINIFERNSTKRYFAFDSFISDVNYSNIFSRILALMAPLPN